jgi:hypothetical protein
MQSRPSSADVVPDLPSQIVRWAVVVLKSRPLRWVTITDFVCRLLWTGSWTGASDNPSAASAISAITRVICAASVRGAGGRTSCKRQASGSNPLTGSQFSSGIDLTSSPIRGTNNTDDPGYPSVTSRVAKGSHKTTAQRVVPGLRARRDRSAHQTRDPPQGHSEDRAAQITSSGVV